jgi:hypothetical protein
MTEAKSTRPARSNTKKRRKKDDLGDDKVIVTTANPTPSDPVKPPVEYEGQPKRKRA